MRATYLIFGVILMTLVVSGAGIMISDLTTEYNVSYDADSIAVYDKLNETNALAEQINNKIQNQRHEHRYS